MDLYLVRARLVPSPFLIPTRTRFTSAWVNQQSAVTLRMAMVFINLLMVAKHGNELALKIRDRYRASAFIQKTPTLFMSQRRVTFGGQTNSAESSVQRMVAKPGNECSIEATKPEPVT